MHCGNKDAQLIKLCDRLRRAYIARIALREVHPIHIGSSTRRTQYHNMETLDPMPQHKQQQKCAETRKFFLPVAEELGLSELAQRLEELCGKYDGVGVAKSKR